MPQRQIDGGRRPHLSVVVACYNMAREIPRTIRSLSTLMQKEIEQVHYELIVVDNGSTSRFDEKACLECAENVRFLYYSKPTPSPVHAINWAIEQARGELVGVLVDGARMASPGLLNAAMQVSLLHPRPVIGTIAFHIGPDVQQKTVHSGYNTQVEDALLADIGWEDDGYKLFNASVLALSSAGGWFRTPSESNAVFMTKTHWQELGGFDPAFTTPGGGLVNLDLWARACSDPNSQLFMLLGEATFHQVHGGVATNAVDGSSVDLFREEYRSIRGRDFVMPKVDPIFFGRLPQALHG